MNAQTEGLDLSDHLRTQGLPSLRRGPVTTLQINIGKR